MTVDLLVQALLAWLLILAVCVAVAEALYPRVARPVRRLALAGRLHALVAVSWLPVAVATALVGGAYLPSLLARVGWAVDHCERHPGHIHLCGVHVEPVAFALAGWALAIVATVWLGAGALELAREGFRGRRFQSALRAVARPDGPAVTSLDATVPFAMTAGIVRPRVFVTSGLSAALSTRQRRAVLAHERCHARERHALIKLFATLGTLALRPSTRSALLGEITLACERRADEAAAREMGDRLETASALLATRRAFLRHSAQGVLGLHGASCFEARIRELMEIREPRRVGSGLGSALLALVAAGVVAGHELHHGIETAMSVFVH